MKTLFILLLFLLLPPAWALDKLDDEKLSREQALSNVNFSVQSGSSKEPEARPPVGPDVLNRELQADDVRFYHFLGTNLKLERNW